MSAPPRTARATWHLKANAIAVAYLAASVVAAIVQATGHGSRWLVVHLLLLGAVTNAIVIWTGHFTTTLLQTPPTTTYTASRRLVALNIGVLGVLVGVPTNTPVSTVAGAALLAGVIATHVRALVRTVGMRRNSRFANAMRFYWAAAFALLTGIAAGVALTRHLSTDWQSRLYSSHVHLNVFGWVGLTGSAPSSRCGRWCCALASSTALSAQLVVRSCSAPPGSRLASPACWRRRGR